LDLKILVRNGVFEVLDLLSGRGEGVTVKELREKVPISKSTLQVLRKSGLVELSYERVVVREVPVKLKRASYWLSEKGMRMIELFESLSEVRSTDLLRITSKQLECLKLLLKGEKKYMTEIPKGLRPTLQSLVQRGLAEKYTTEEEEKRKVRRKRLVYRITEKGVKARKLLKTIKSL